MTIGDLLSIVISTAERNLSGELVEEQKVLANNWKDMKLSTLKLLVPIVAVTIQSNSASTVIPPYLDHMRIPVALIGTLDFARADLRTHGASAHRHALQPQPRAARLLSLAILAMGLTNYCYSFAASSLSFALVHCLNGFAYSAVTTLYMAFYVDSLAPDENRNHAMGYYVGCLAMGYSTGNFFGGLIADHWGYSWTFQLGALLSFVAVALLWFLHGPSSDARSTG